MIAFVAAMVLAAVLSLRGGDRALLQGLARSGFAWEPPIAVAVLTGGLTCAAAAFIGNEAVQAAEPLGPNAALWIGSFGLAAALVRFLSIQRAVQLREPTRSIFAFGAVLLVLQSLDAVRLAVFAVAALTGEPLLAACGGFLGAPVGLAQSAPEHGR